MAETSDAGGPRLVGRPIGLGAQHFEFGLVGHTSSNGEPGGFGVRRVIPGFCHRGTVPWNWELGSGSDLRQRVARRGGEEGIPWQRASPWGTPWLADGQEPAQDGMRSRNAD